MTELQAIAIRLDGHTLQSKPRGILRSNSDRQQLPKSELKSEKKLNQER